MSLTIDQFETEETSETSSVSAPDAVAIRSHSYEFGGKELRPFSRLRQIVAQSMGVKAFSTAMASLSQEMAETGNYPGMLQDAVFIVWLMLADDKRVYRAQRKTAEAQEDALRWWDSDGGGDVGSAKYGELLETFFGVLNDLATVAAETQGGGDSEGLGE